MLVLLSPEGFESQTGEEMHQDMAFESLSLTVLMAKFCMLALNSACSGWNTLAQYIDTLLGTGDEIFDIEAHDNLIFDDDLYTRSRRYFLGYKLSQRLRKDTCIE